MNYTTITAATTMDQHVRNTMSIMAWVMAALCAWVMWLSVHALADAAHADPDSLYPTAVSAPRQ